jgi:hypothetical protein
VDTAYRVRGAQEISAVGSGTIDAIAADVRAVSGVQSVFALENTADVYDVVTGLPPHSFQIIVWDGVSPLAANNGIAQAIWSDKPAGISAYGPTNGTAVDSLGTSHLVAFTRATQRPLYLSFTLTLFPGQTLTSAARLAIKQAVVEATQSTTIVSPVNGTTAPNPAFLGLGQEVYAEAMKGAVMNAGLYVQNVSDCRLDWTATPTGTADLPVAQYQIAIADTSRILVNGS